MSPKEITIIISLPDDAAVSATQAAILETSLPQPAILPEMVAAASGDESDLPRPLPLEELEAMAGTPLLEQPKPAPVEDLGANGKDGGQEPKPLSTDELDSLSNNSDPA